jgi:uncharacterized protein (DUF58 family)
MRFQLSFMNRFLRFTPEGTKFILISIAVGFAAINTGNNLLYLILGMLLSLIIASGILSELGIKGLEVKRHLSPYIFAHTPSSAFLSITNKKRYFPSFSLEVEERVEGEIKDRLAYFFRVEPKSAQTRSYHLFFSHRGINQLQGPYILTRFPFGLFIKGIRHKECLKVLVYPQLLPWKTIQKDVSPLGEGPRTIPQKGRGENIFGIREYLPGDTSRDIHWRSTAKLSQTMVKEYEKVGMKKVHIVLDTSLPKEESSSDLDQFERCVSKAASLAYYLLKRQDILVGLSLGDKFIRFNKGEQHVHYLLESLALVQPQRSVGRQLIPHKSDSFTVIFTVRG